MNFHAHIYWTDQISRALALGLREYLDELGCTLGRVHDRAIGPHPLPMYQAEYPDLIRPEVETYLTDNADGLSILLHRDTGDDITDHTVGTRWINDPVDLDIAWLEEYVKHKDH